MLAPPTTIAGAEPGRTSPRTSADTDEHWRSLAGNRARLAAVLLVGFAMIGIYRALYDPGALAHGAPFCLLP